MKFRHNKKRNPAFIFEALTREFAKAKLHNDKEGLKKIKKIMQEVFNKDGLLYKQLRLYKALTETRDVDYLTAEKIIAEVHRVFSTFEQKALYAANINCSSCLGSFGKYKGRKDNGSRKKQNRNERRKGIATSLSLMIIPPIRECFLLFLLFHLP